MSDFNDKHIAKIISEEFDIGLQRLAMNMSGRWLEMYGERMDESACKDWSMFLLEKLEDLNDCKEIL